MVNPRLHNCRSADPRSRRLVAVVCHSRMRFQMEQFDLQSSFQADGHSLSALGGPILTFQYLDEQVC